MSDTKRIIKINTDPPAEEGRATSVNLDDTQKMVKETRQEATPQAVDSKSPAQKTESTEKATAKEKEAKNAQEKPVVSEKQSSEHLHVVEKGKRPEPPAEAKSSKPSAMTVMTGERKYINTDGRPRGSVINYNIIKKAAEKGEYTIEEEVAKGAESVLYAAEVGGHRVCVKAIRNRLNRILGDSKTRNQAEKLTNVPYRTKLRHIKNEYEVSQVLYSEREMPVVHIYALRRVTFWGLELGYDLIMELFNGHDLGEKTVHKSLTLEDKIRVVYQCAQALDYLHKRGYIHLDIKPSNFILHNGRVKLLDFGVSVKSGYKPRAITGTGGYLSPEQISKTVLDEKTDIFALGLTFAVLFGGKPLQQSQKELLSKQFRNDAKYQLETDDISVISEMPDLVDEAAFAQIIKDCSIPRRNMRVASCQVLIARIKAWAAENNFDLDK